MKFEKLLPLLLSILIPAMGVAGSYAVLKYRVDEIAKKGQGEITEDKIEAMIQAGLQPLDEKITQSLKEHSAANDSDKANTAEHIRLLNDRMLEIEKSLYRMKKK